MDAYFYNTATRQRYNINYLDFTIDGGGASATYQSAEVPSTTNQYLYWVNTVPARRTLTITMLGNDVLDDIETLKSFCYPPRRKTSPPVLKFKIGNLPVVNVIFENIKSELELLDKRTLYDFNFRLFPTVRSGAEAKSTGRDDSISAFERFKNFLKSRFGEDEPETEPEYYEEVIQEVNVPQFDLFKRGQWSRYFQTNLTNKTKYRFLKAKVTLNFIELRDGSDILSNR